MRSTFSRSTGDYPRGHLTRFASIYTTGRANYAISYPNNNTALALPLDNGRSIRGEDVTTSVWQSSPVPALIGPLRPAAQPVAVPGRGDGDPGRVDPAGRATARAGGWSTAASWSSATRPSSTSAARIASSGRSDTWGRSPREPRSRSARRPRRTAPERIDGGPGSGPEPVPRGGADDLGAPRREPRRDPAGRLGAADDARPGHRAAAGPPARVHGRPRPPPQRPATQPGRAALQHPGPRPGEAGRHESAPAELDDAVRAVQKGMMRRTTPRKVAAPRPPNR